MVQKKNLSGVYGEKTDIFLNEGLKHNLFSISQFCDKGNSVNFTDEHCVVSNAGTGTKILEGTRKGNTYMVDLNLVSRNNLTCLSAVDNEPLLWHKRCGHTSMALLQKLSGKDLVVRLPTIKVINHEVCANFILQYRLYITSPSHQPKNWVLDQGLEDLDLRALARR